MHSFSWLLALLGACAVVLTHAELTAVPRNLNSSSSSSSPTEKELDVLSAYFNSLARMVQVVKSIASSPVCDMRKAVLPLGRDLLPPPTAGLSLKHVAFGYGTQNYTCQSPSSLIKPQPIGAVATLFNVSCVASMYPSLLNMLPAVALATPLPTAANVINLPEFFSSNPVVSGHHVFINKTTPHFNMNTPTLQLGEASCVKNASSPAPADAPHGRQGEAAVQWLKLLTLEGSTGGLHEIYRVQTAGGSPPADCENMPAAFEVQYAAQYWFFEKKT